MTTAAPTARTASSPPVRVLAAHDQACPGRRHERVGASGDHREREGGAEDGEMPPSMSMPTSSAKPSSPKIIREQDHHDQNDDQEHDVADDAWISSKNWWSWRSMLDRSFIVGVVLGSDADQQGTDEDAMTRKFDGIDVLAASVRPSACPADRLVVLFGVTVFRPADRPAVEYVPTRARTLPVTVPSIVSWPVPAIRPPGTDPEVVSVTCPPVARSNPP